MYYLEHKLCYGRRILFLDSLQQQVPKDTVFLKEHLYIQTISRGSRSDGLIRK